VDKQGGKNQASGQQPHWTELEEKPYFFTDFFWWGTEKELSGIVPKAPLQH
jgi:hypothetical protein